MEAIGAGLAAIGGGISVIAGALGFTAIALIASCTFLIYNDKISIEDIKGLFKKDRRYR